MYVFVCKYANSVGILIGTEQFKSNTRMVISKAIKQNSALLYFLFKIPIYGFKKKTEVFNFFSLLIMSVALTI